MTADVWAGGLLMARYTPARGETLAWFYDVNGQMLGFTLNDVPYFYVRNLQGDIVAILDEYGIIVAEYAFDAWGNLLYYSGHMARVNPITYRGYYWDWELDLFYLQSRYYDPSLRRFISADVFMDTGVGILGTNMYIYCNNDPVNFYDPTGFSPEKRKKMFATKNSNWLRFMKYQIGTNLLNNMQHDMSPSEPVAQRYLARTNELLTGIFHGIDSATLQDEFLNSAYTLSRHAGIYDFNQALRVLQSGEMRMGEFHRMAYDAENPPAEAFEFNWRGLGATATAGFATGTVAAGPIADAFGATPKGALARIGLRLGGGLTGASINVIGFTISELWRWAGGG